MDCVYIANKVGTWPCGADHIRCVSVLHCCKKANACHTNIAIDRTEAPDGNVHTGCVRCVD